MRIRGCQGIGAKKVAAGPCANYTNLARQPSSQRSIDTT